MGFKWPRLVHELDCGPIGLPGVVVEMCPNPEPLPGGMTFSGKDWDKATYHGQARFFWRVIIPAQYREDGEAWAYDIDQSAEKLWNLEQEAGFDSRIILWAMSEIARTRYQAISVAEKN